MALTDEQERIYRRLLDAPGVDPQAGDVLGQLRALGLIDDHLIPLPPAEAMERLVRLRMEQAARDLHQIGALWDVVKHFTDQPHGRQVELVERIEGRSAVTQRIMATPCNEVMNVKKAPATLPGVPGYKDIFRRRMAAGTISRTVVWADSLNDPDQLAYARSMEAIGDRHRTVDDRPRTFVLLDRAVAFVRLDPADPGKGALMIRQPGIVATLVDLFEVLWARGRDLEEPPLTPLERQVLNALSTFSKDELAARAVNVSVRKFRTHVADLMTRLGATSRFQAALLAKERRWI